MSRTRRTFAFSFSWKRAIGRSAAGGRCPLRIAILLTRSDRQPRIRRMVTAGGCGGAPRSPHGRNAKEGRST
jgi:hypothetical protein